MKKAWAVMIAAFFGSIVVAANQFKIPPTMDLLLDQFQVDMAVGGWLMSIFAVSGIILALPAAVILEKIGPKKSGLIALGCTMLGSIIGALAPNAQVLLASRCIEGIGLGLIAVVTPAVISMWFPPEKRGLPIGIWSTFIPIGCFIIYNTADWIIPLWGWQGVWWLGAVLAAIAFVFYGLIVSAPSQSHEIPSNEVKKIKMTDAFKSRALWVLVLAYTAWTFSMQGIYTWMPPYLSQVLAFDIGKANFYSSLVLMATIPSCIISGWLLDKVQKNRKKLIPLAALILLIGLSFKTFRLESSDPVLAFLVVFGFIAGFMPASVFALAPETVDSIELVGIAMGLVNLGQNIGMSFGPPISGYIIGNNSWVSGTIPVFVGFLGATIAMIFYRLKDTRVPS